MHFCAPKQFLQRPPCLRRTGREFPTAILECVQTLCNGTYEFTVTCMFTFLFSSKDVTIFLVAQCSDFLKLFVYLKKQRCSAANICIGSGSDWTKAHPTPPPSSNLHKKKSVWTKWGWVWWRLRQADVPAPDCTRGHRPTLRCPWSSCLGSECHQLSFRSRGCLLEKAKLPACTKLPSGVKFWRQGTILCFSSAGVQRLCRPVSCCWKFCNGLQGI